MATTDTVKYLVRVQLGDAQNGESFDGFQPIYDLGLHILADSEGKVSREHVERQVNNIRAAWLRVLQQQGRLKE